MKAKKDIKKDLKQIRGELKHMLAMAIHTVSVMNEVGDLKKRDMLYHLQFLFADKVDEMFSIKQIKKRKK